MKKSTVKLYKSIARESFKDIHKRHSVFVSKKYRKPKYKKNLEAYLDELIEYEEWEAELNENK